MKRVVLDTNIIISSALGGALVLFLEKWDEGKFTVIVTTDVMSEYFAVLSRPKFGLKQETIDKITRHIYQFSEFVVPEEQIRFIEDDPTDDRFLEAAIAGKEMGLYERQFLHTHLSRRAEGGLLTSV